MTLIRKLDRLVEHGLLLFVFGRRLTEIDTLRNATLCPDACPCRGHNNTGESK